MAIIIFHTPETLLLIVVRSNNGSNKIESPKIVWYVTIEQVHK